MKRLDKFILTSFVGPFVAILFVVIFILMMQFLWLYIDELVGKGLGFKVIMEFMAWGSCTILPLALPLSTLLASMMTLGQLGENNELIALKAAGISLSRVMMPLMIVCGFISIGAFFTANDLVPLAFNKIYTLRDDIGKTKEEIKIPTGTFYDGIDGYILRVEKRNDVTGMMYNVMVYDHTNDKGNTSLTLADSAQMRMSKGKDYLDFLMFHGCNYQETNIMNFQDTSLSLQKIRFSRQEMIIQLQNYAFQKSKDTRFSDQVKSMNLKKLTAGRDSLSTLDSAAYNVELGEMTHTYMILFRQQLDSTFDKTARKPFKADGYMSWTDSQREVDSYERAFSNATQCAITMEGYAQDRFEYTYTLRRTNVEILRKFAQSLACLILFLIGAPLGALIRKGGLGVSAIVSILFFVLYWVIDITGTKLARDGAVSAWVGEFISTTVLLPIGAYLTNRAVHDSTLFNTDNLGTWKRKIVSKFLAFFRKTRIVYMGTPEFAVAPLEALIKNRYRVVGVVTVADKPSGRGLKMNESAVKKYAVEHGIPVLQPEKLKDPEFLKALAAWKPDLIVVVAFRMLPEAVWSMPKLGTFNLHAALLPQYRGAAPINWAVINGESITGATTFMIDKAIDTGGIILRQECRINDTDTAGDVHDKLMAIGADLVVQTTEGIIERNVETRIQRSFIQGSEILKPAPKITKELCHIDWDDTTRNVYNLIRGLSPYPTAYTEIVMSGTAQAEASPVPTEMKIFSAEKIEGEAFEAIRTLGQGDIVPGSILSDGKTYLAVATEDGAISIKDLQLAGKKRMDVKAFLLGFRDPCSYTTTRGTSKAEIEKTRPVSEG
jgi:methionyl-tRNA formyltransferase